MEVIALIVEQLDQDGRLRSLRVAPDYRRKLVVAFADEYDEHRAGPFHFLDPTMSRAYDRGFASAQARKVSRKNFHVDGEVFHFETSFQGIPTKPNCLTYYALSLPEYAIPETISVFDPHSGREYRKNVTRDDVRNRFVVYLECRSSRGVFDFELKTQFKIDRVAFSTADYSDAKTDKYGRQIDEYKYVLDEHQNSKIQNFFAERITMENYNNSGQVGAMGRNAKANDMSLQQVANQNPIGVDMNSLAAELSKLRDAMRSQSTAPEHDMAIGQVAAAENAAKNGDGNAAMDNLKRAGTWTLGIAEKIGVGIATAAIKTSMGL
jgi:hypothetical protein